MAIRPAIGATCIFFLAACSSTTPRAPSDSSQEEKTTDDGAESKKNSPAAGQPIAVEALAWGPYLTQETPDDGKGIAWESGSISMRQIEGDDLEDIFDYRWYLSAAASGDNTLPTESTEGCESFPSRSSFTSDSFVDEASFSGAFTADAEGSSILQVSDKDEDSSFSYNTEDELTATFTADGKTVQESAPDQPASHNLQLSGAYAGSLDVNTVMKVLNANLESESNDLVLSDQGEGTSYTTAVVLFFPGADAATGNVRCVVPAGGRITIPAAEYKDWLPLKGFIAFSAQTDLVENDGISVWKSTVRGDGVEDLDVP